MITHLLAPSCGAAVALQVSLDPAAERWRLLRRPDEDFTGADDPDARLIEEWTDYQPYPAVLDYTGLVNGTPVWYALYARDSGAWALSGDPATVTPAYLAEPLYTAPDLAELLRERLHSALQAEVAAQRLRHESGAIPVLVGYPQIESVRLPVVTVLLMQRAPSVRGVGELVIPDVFDPDGWNHYEGWLDRSTVQIGVWSLNHEDRVQIRNAVQRALILNLPILDAAGFTLPDLSLSDTQDFEAFNAPIYQSVFTFSADHPALVRTSYPHSLSAIEAAPYGDT